MASAPSTLGTAAILKGMADALPAHPPGDDSSDLASSYEAVALLIHAYLAALGFELCGFDEDKPMDCASIAPRLPSQWNARFGSLAFVYRHKQSSMRFVVRVDRMGGKVEVRGLAVGADTIHRFERAVRDVVRSDGLPLRVTLGSDGAEDRSDLVDKMKALFVSEQAIVDILHDLKVNIVQKLIPKLQREGYVEVDDRDAQEAAQAERRAQESRDPNRPFRGGEPQQPHPHPHPHPHPLPELARPRPLAPVGDFPPPGFDDEYEMNRPPRAGAGIILPDGRSPFNIGHDDLNPPGLGPHDPLRGSFVPGGGLPLPGRPSGMHPTFDDPLFAGQRSPGGFVSDSDPMAGYYDPQSPPGSRWDPVGPGGGPRHGGPGGSRGGNYPFGDFGGGGGYGGGGFGGGGHII